MDAIDLLKQDHDRVKDIFSQLESAEEPAQKHRLAEQVIQELLVHERIEEDVFYPAFKEAAKKEEQKDLVEEATEEHHVVDLIINELQEVDPKGRDFEAKVTVMKEMVEHHIEEEEEEMFPAARKLLGEDKLTELGQVMGELKQNLGKQAKAGKKQEH